MKKLQEKLEFLLDKYAVSTKAELLSEKEESVFDSVEKSILRDRLDRLIAFKRFLGQDVDAVVLMIAVAETADIHAGARPDVLKRGQGLDVGICIGACVR